MLKSKLSVTKSSLRPALGRLARFIGRDEAQPGREAETLVVLLALLAAAVCGRDWGLETWEFAGLAALLAARSIYLREVEQQRYEDWALLQRQIDKLAPPQGSP